MFVLNLYDFIKNRYNFKHFVLQNLLHSIPIQHYFQIPTSPSVCSRQTLYPNFSLLLNPFISPLFGSWTYISLYIVKLILILIFFSFRFLFCAMVLLFGSYYKALCQICTSLWFWFTFWAWFNCFICQYINYGHVE